MPIGKAKMFLAAWLVLCAVLQTVTCYSVLLTAPDHALLGSSANVSAQLLDKGEPAAKGSYRFTWTDSAGHRQVMETSVASSNWSLTFAQEEPTTHVVKVEVEKFYSILWLTEAKGEKKIKLDSTLSGTLELIQKNVTRTHDFVSTQEAVNHSISLSASDLEFLRAKGYHIQTYWFQNCTYLGMSGDLDYIATYPQAEQSFDVEALVVASLELPPEPTPSTTTTTTTTPKPTTTTPTVPTTTSTKAPDTTTPKPAPRSKRDLVQAMHTNAALLGLNLTNALKQQKGSAGNVSVALVNPLGVRRLSKLNVLPGMQPPFDCVNKKFIAQDPKQIYGYFQRRIVTRDPISAVDTKGKNWLQHWEMLSLDVSCKGSPPFEFCSKVFTAPYNATGNETCELYDPMVNCSYEYMRYFSESKTILFFIRNEVSQTLNQVTINMYEAQRQSQLSVVVVPVTCTLVAVILVVFGVAYYIQRGNRFTVEVADFNFGDTQSVDMEYKTFPQRLVDSIREAWSWPGQRRHSQSSADLMADDPPSPGFAGNVGDVDSNLRYNTFN